MQNTQTSVPENGGPQASENNVEQPPSAAGIDLLGGLVLCSPPSPRPRQEVNTTGRFLALHMHKGKLRTIDP